MKLGTLKGVRRDGTLVVVSRDLSRYAVADEIAPTLQAALDDWETVSPALRRLADQVEERQVPTRSLDPREMAAPLPRSYSWMDGSAYLNHMELARKLRNAKPPEGYKDTPVMYEGISSRFLGCRDPLIHPPGENGRDVGLDIECEIGAIVGDVEEGADSDVAASAIRLITIVNDTSLRAVMADRFERGLNATVHGKPPCSMPVVAVTPDELSSAWDGRKMSLPIVSHVNGELLGRPDTGVDLSFDLPTLIAYAARFRPLGAGTIIGSGTVSNRDSSVGCGCIAERRMLEVLEGGEAGTRYLSPGDAVRIEVFGVDGKSVFGAIEHRVVARR